MSDTGIRENGDWHVETSRDGRVSIESTDFTHDAALAVSGDFETNGQKLAYANEIAKRLNHYTGHE